MKKKHVYIRLYNLQLILDRGCESAGGNCEQSKAPEFGNVLFRRGTQVPHYLKV